MKEDEKRAVFVRECDSVNLQTSMKNGKSSGKDKDSVNFATEAFNIDAQK